MTKNEAFAQLRTTVASLFDDSNNIRRLVTDAGCDAARINFQGSAQEIWHGVLTEAERNSTIESIVTLARQEYPRDQKLAKSYETYRQFIESSPVENSRIPAQKLVELSSGHLLAAGQSTSLWQIHQTEGDRLFQLARHADLIQGSRAYWEHAENEYKQALGIHPSPETMQAISLYRKLATVQRKLGKEQSVITGSLEEGEKRIEEAQEQMGRDKLLLLEGALYQLEHAYCDYDQREWGELYTHSRDLIKKFENDKYRTLHPDFRYILGCTYNLLAIALEQTDTSKLNAGKDSAESWKKAKEYLQQINDGKSNDVLNDIELNEAGRLNHRGNCDEAIKKLESILKREKPSAPLQTLSRVAVNQTLAAAYLGRLAKDDLDKAHALALENLAWAKRQEDVVEWFYALLLYLTVIRMFVNPRLPQTVSDWIQQAEYEHSLFCQAFEQSDDDPDRLELQRLLAEIYLAADKLSEATLEIEFIEKHRQQADEQDEGDIYLTLANFHQKRSEFQQAQFNLGEARLRFERAQRLGKVIETDLKWAEIEASQNQWAAAKKRLQATRAIARMLCPSRLAQVAAQLTKLNQPPSPPNPSPTSTITILFLASDPTDLPRLRLAEEWREIENQLQLAKQRDKYNFQSRMAVRAQDITKALLEVQPQIVHFSGHGATNGGLYFEDRVGEAQLTPPDALTALFAHFSKQITCVVLNSCYSESQAQAIAQSIPNVIGMSHLLQDQAAIAFSVGFYQALGAGRSIEESFDLGRIQIGLQGVLGHLLPVLLRREVE